MLRRSSQPSVEEVVWPEVRKGPTGGAAPHSTWNWIFYYDTATTPQLCTVRLSCAAFSHIQRAILDNWNIKLSSLNLKVNCMFLQHTAHTRTERHIHTHIHIPTSIHTCCKSNCICCIFYPIWESRLPAALIISSLKLKIKNTYMSHLHKDTPTYIYINCMFLQHTAHTRTERHIHTHIHIPTYRHTYIQKWNCKLFFVIFFARRCCAP